MINATELVAWAEPLTRFNSLNDGWSATAWRAVSRALDATTMIVSRSGYLLAVETADLHSSTPLVFLAPGSAIASLLPSVLAVEIEHQLSNIESEATRRTSVRIVEFDGRHYRMSMIPSDDLRSAIVVVTVADLLQISGTDQNCGLHPNLTLREQQVLELVANGFSNKQMASKLRLRPKTIEKHRSSLMRKLNARSVADLMRFWFRMHPDTLSQPPGSDSLSNPFSNPRSDHPEENGAEGESISDYE